MECDRSRAQEIAMVFSGVTNRIHSERNALKQASRIFGKYLLSPRGARKFGLKWKDGQKQKSCTIKTAEKQRTATK